MKELKLQTCQDYEAPRIEIIEIQSEGAILTASSASSGNISDFVSGNDIWGDTNQ